MNAPLGSNHLGIFIDARQHPATLHANIFHGFQQLPRRGHERKKTFATRPAIIFKPEYTRSMGKKKPFICFVGNSVRPYQSEGGGWVFGRGTGHDESTTNKLRECSGCEYSREEIPCYTTIQEQGISCHGKRDAPFGSCQ